MLRVCSLRLSASAVSGGGKSFPVRRRSAPVAARKAECVGIYPKRSISSAGRKAMPALRANCRSDCAVADHQRAGEIDVGKVDAGLLRHARLRLAVRIVGRESRAEVDAVYPAAVALDFFDHPVVYAIQIVEAHDSLADAPLVRDDRECAGTVRSSGPDGRACPA